MACIKIQKLIYNDDGTIHSGSASVIDTVYDKTIKGSSRKITREKLGKVLYINDTHTCGIFLSPSRGLIEYDSKQDAFSDVSRDDARINSPDLFIEPYVHTVFGDAYLIIRFLEKCGLMRVLRTAFIKDQDYEKAVCHLLHVICRNGSHISCDYFFIKSFASYVLTDIPVERLGSDSAYFERMSDDSLKLAFFQNFVQAMREKEPDFGVGCYIDSTPLPNDICGNPLNALCSHGLTSTSVQTRLVLILDEGTGLPVWFSIIPGNILDLSTVKTVMSDVSESLGIRIDDIVVDAGYVCKDLICEFNLDSPKVAGIGGQEKLRTMLARMPAKKGYPYKQLYHETKQLIHNAKYEFDRESHTYFGICREKVLFGCRINAYVYVDKDNALALSRKNRLKDPDTYENFSMAEKNWFDVKFGYFVLLTNKSGSPAEILDAYFGRTRIENVFKTGKEYLEILPLSKWTRERVTGKLFSDIIAEIAFLMLRKELCGEGIAATRLIGSTSSLMCMKKRNGTIEVETASKQVREFYKRLKIQIPSSFKLAEFRKTVVLLEN